MEFNKKIKFLFITGNVGSLFEEFGGELKRTWIKEFHQLVLCYSPTFIGLHLQEVGGKTGNVLKEEVQEFFENLYKSEHFDDFHSIHGYIDEEYTEDKYTALGCLYFVHKSISDLFELWSFTDNQFNVLQEKRVLHSMSEESCAVRKLKFPLSCYSKHVERWPRKGFTWTRWRINKKIFDMLNVHLTHDACNIKVALKSITKYAKHRRRALEYVLERLSDMPSSEHQILYGDFNVRPDTKALIENLLDNKASQHKEDDGNGEIVSLVYKSLNGSATDLLKIGTRYFEFSRYDAFCHAKIPEIIQFDKELEWILRDRFKEMLVTFQPTYPHTEEPDFKGDYSYANVRCPSWCDRIIVDTPIFNSSIKDSPAAVYSSYGEGVQLGDHKPVYLFFEYPVN